jgi:hypothetical protein
VPHLVLTFRTPLSDAFRILTEDIKKEPRGFYFLYTADFDSILHKSANDNRGKITPFLKSLEGKVREVYNAALEKYQNINLYLFSDHGMCNVAKTFDLRTMIQELPITEFKDYVPFYDSTMARFNTFNGHIRELLTEKLSLLSFGRVLPESELEELGVFFPDNKYGDIIYLMNPGNLINPSFMGITPPKGMHGYHPDHKDSYAAFLSNHEQKKPINSIRDFYGIMKKSVGKI